MDMTVREGQTCLAPWGNLGNHALIRFQRECKRMRPPNRGWVGVENLNVEGPESGFELEKTRVLRVSDPGSAWVPRPQHVDSQVFKNRHGSWDRHQKAAEGR